MRKNNVAPVYKALCPEYPKVLLLIKMTKHAAAIVAILTATDAHNIDRFLLLNWLNQEVNTPEENINAIMQQLIALKDTQAAKDAAEHLQSAIDGTKLGGRYPNLLGMLHIDDTFSSSDSSSGAAVIVRSTLEAEEAVIVGKEKKVVACAADDYDDDGEYEFVDVAVEEECDDGEDAAVLL